MAIKKIVELGDSILGKVSHKVTNFDERLWGLLDDMKDTLYESGGVGLAAVQIGILRRVVVIDIDDDYTELINPVITETEGSQYGVEGCLSVPGKQGNVQRPMQVTFEAYDRNGNKYTKTVSELFARCVCHELDHLDGKLYVEIADDIVDTRID